MQVPRLNVYPKPTAVGFARDGTMYSQQQQGAKRQSANSMQKQQGANSKQQNEETRDLEEPKTRKKKATIIISRLANIIS
jgi:hypothetical protein